MLRLHFQLDVQVAELFQLGCSGGHPGLTLQFLSDLTRSGYYSKSERSNQPSQLETLDDPLAPDEHYANYSRRNTGRHAFLIGADGPLFLMPQSFADGAASHCTHLKKTVSLAESVGKFIWFGELS